MRASIHMHNCMWSHEQQNCVGPLHQCLCNRGLLQETQTVLRCSRSLFLTYFIITLRLCYAVLGEGRISLPYYSQIWCLGLCWRTNWGMLPIDQMFLVYLTTRNCSHKTWLFYRVMVVKGFLPPQVHLLMRRLHGSTQASARLFWFILVSLHLPLVLLSCIPNSTGDEPRIASAYSDIQMMLKFK